MSVAFDLNTVWFLLVGALLTGYAILDGFDLGVGAIHLLAKSDEERRIHINAIGPGGYFVDFVRCFKVGDNWTQAEKDLYKECYESLYSAIAQIKPGASTKDVAQKFPKYADDEHGSVSLQQFAHSIGLDLYEGMWISRAYSLDYPAEIKQNMAFAIETFTGRAGLKQSVRLEEDLVVTDKGTQILTLFPHQAGFGD